MANNRKKRNTNQKPEEAKTQAPVTEEAEEVTPVKESKAEPKAESSAKSSADREKQRKEDRQNLLLLIGVVAFLAVVGIVIWLTSGSSDEEKASAATTAQVAAADATAAAETAVAEAETETEEEAEAVEETAEETEEEAVEEEAAPAEEEAAPAEEEAAPAEEEVQEIVVEDEEDAAPAEEAAAPAEEVTSTTVLDAGTVYAIENPMTLYSEASTDSEAVMELVPGWSVAIEEAAEAGNGWHRVSVWLSGAPTYGFIQIP